MADSKQHNTDYVTKFKYPYLQKIGDQVVIWYSPTVCEVIVQLKLF